LVMSGRRRNTFARWEISIIDVAPGHGIADLDARISWVYYRINSCPRLPDKRQRLF
jgi:hypothetical protein